MLQLCQVQTGPGPLETRSQGSLRTLQVTAGEGVLLSLRGRLSGLVVSLAGPVSLLQALGLGLVSHKPHAQDIKLHNVQYKPIWNCHNGSPLYNEYTLIKKKTKTKKERTHLS
jgi:hypothetical protein